MTDRVRLAGLNLDAGATPYRREEESQLSGDLQCQMRHDSSTTGPPMAANAAWTRRWLRSLR